MSSSAEQEEEFVYLVQCIDDLNNAWRLISRIQQDKDNVFAYPAFQFALIEYSKPYTTSFGKIRRKRNGLGEQYLPVEHRDLHYQILRARDTFLAHSDLTIRDARLYVYENPWGKETGISSNIINAAMEYSRIDDIRDLIEKTLTNLYEAEKLLTGELEVNS